jgi:XTP/dITP diphosphohydrolase
MQLPFSTLVLATHSAGKLAEFHNLLADWPCRVLGAQEVVSAGPPEETGETYLDNAVLKAKLVAAQGGHWTLADDTGLEVAALDGQPGVRSGRFAGETRVPGANRQKLLTELQRLPRQCFAAQFVCHLVLVDPAGTTRASSIGVCRGEIQSTPAGTRGFGYDTLFRLPEWSRTMAELTPLVLSRLGHRGRAVAHLHQHLLHFGNERQI